MITDSIRQQITAFLAENNPDVFILEMEMHQGSRNVLSMRIDSDEGIRLEQCVAASRNLGPWLEESGFFDYDHGLEVSSPGATEPLTLKRQYPKNIGRELLITTLDGTELLGKLEEVTEETLSLRPRLKKKPVKGRPIKYANELTLLPFDNIHRAIVHI